MEINKGTFRKEVGQLEIRDFEISNIIVSALIEKGFELTSKPIIDSMNNQVGEQIIICRIEQR